MNDEEPRLRTELALASDGILYVCIEDEPPPDRRLFVGYALHPDELKRYGVAHLLLWALLQPLAIGSDGCVYVHESAIDGEGRERFRGFATTQAERARLMEEFHRTAFNLTIAVFSGAGR